MGNDSDAALSLALCSVMCLVLCLVLCSSSTFHNFGWASPKPVLTEMVKVLFIQTAEAPVLFSQLFIRYKHSRMHIFNPFVTTNDILHQRTHSKSQQLPMTDSFTDLDHLAACVFYNYTMYSDALLCTAPAMFSSTELNWFTTLRIRLRNKSVASDWCSTIWQKTSLQACNC